MKRTLILAALFMFALAGAAQEKLEVVSNMEAMDHLIEIQPARYQANMAQAARIQGTVAIVATIGPDGKVVEARVVSGHPLLVDGARLAVGSWRFIPFERDGKPTKVNVKVDVGIPFGYPCDLRNEYYSKVNQCRKFVDGKHFAEAEKSCKMAASLADRMAPDISVPELKHWVLYERARSLGLLGLAYMGAARYTEAEKSLQIAFETAQKLPESDNHLTSVIESELALAKSKRQQ